MTKSKTQRGDVQSLSREELVAQLEAMDKADEVTSLKREVADMAAHAKAVAAERDTLAKRNRDLEKILREINGTLAPIRPSLEAGTNLSRGRVYTPITRPDSAGNSGVLEAPQSKISEKRLQEVFPELAS